MSLSYLSRYYQCFRYIPNNVMYLFLLGSYNYANICHPFPFCPWDHGSSDGLIQCNIQIKHLVVTGIWWSTKRTWEKELTTIICINKWKNDKFTGK